MTDYSKKGHYYIEEPRFEVRKLAALLPRGADILDIGAGFGNNTKYLLDAGYNVTALEPNPEAIKTLRILEANYSGRLEAIEGSLDNYRPTKEYDAIICCMVIHFMQDKPSGVQAIRDIQSWTKSGGINLITGYTDSQALSSDYSFLLEPGELLELYAGWEIPWYEESFRIALSRISGLGDILRLIMSRKGFKAARTIASKPRAYIERP